MGIIIIAVVIFGSGFALGVVIMFFDCKRQEKNEKIL